MLAEFAPLLAAKNWSAIVALGLERWRRTKAPMDAEIVERASSKLRREPLPKRFGKGAFQDMWVRRAMNKEPADLPVLLDSFTTELTTTLTNFQFQEMFSGSRVRRAWTESGVDRAVEQGIHMTDGRFLALAPRIEALAGFGADPRISRKMIQLLSNAPFGESGLLGIAMYGPMFQLLVEMKDPRWIEKLELIMARPPLTADRAYFERMIGFALRDLRPIPVRPEDPGGTLAVAQALGFKASEPPSRPVADDDLFAQVVANLADDDVRGVLADRWLEGGHTQGELIAIQLRQARGDTRDGDEERINTLLHYGERAWLGDLAVVTRGRIYSRGLVDELELSPETVVPRERWLAAANDPRLGTVRSLRASPVNHPFYRDFLLSPAMVNLERAFIPSIPLLAELVEHPRFAQLRWLKMPDASFSEGFELLDARGWLCEMPEPLKPWRAIRRSSSSSR